MFRRERRRNGRASGGDPVRDALKRSLCAVDERWSLAQGEAIRADRERISMRINPFLEFLRAFFQFLLALLGRGGAPAG
jgi:hypothetical protein